MTNTDTRLAGYKARAVNIMTPTREAKEVEKADLADLKQEMKSNGLSKVEIKGVMLAARRAFEDRDKAEERSAAEAVADSLALSGTAPLFGAAA